MSTNQGPGEPLSPHTPQPAWSHRLGHWPGDSLGPVGPPGPAPHAPRSGGSHGLLRCPARPEQVQARPDVLARQEGPFRTGLLSRAPGRSPVFASLADGGGGAAARRQCLRDAAKNGLEVTTPTFREKPGWRLTASPTRGRGRRPQVRRLPPKHPRFPPRGSAPDPALVALGGHVQFSAPSRTPVRMHPRTSTPAPERGSSCPARPGHTLGRLVSGLFCEGLKAQDLLRALSSRLPASD